MCGQKFAIYFVSFTNTYVLNATLARMYARAESTRFRDRTFDFEDLIDWDSAKSNKVTILDWDGLAFSSEDTRPFMKGEMDPLLRKEQAFLKIFRDVAAPYWIIAAAAGDDETLRHEFVHCVYMAFPEYKADVRAYLSTMKLKAAHKRLCAMGYSRRSHLDELNAYILTGIVAELRGLQLTSAKRDLERIFKQHFGFLPRGEKGLAEIKSRIHRVRFRVPKRKAPRRRQS